MAQTMRPPPRPPRNGLQRRPLAPPTTEGARGFALLLVIILSALLAGMALTFAAAVRGHLRTVGNAVANAEADALADAGITLAHLDLLADTRAGPLVRSVGPIGCRLPDGAVIVRTVTDETGKVDLNLAGESLLRRLLLGAGVAPGREEAVVAALLDYRDSDDDRRLDGAEAAEYADPAAAPGTGPRLGLPRNAPLETVDELASVVGLTRADVERLRPFVTVRSGQDGIDPVHAPPGLVALLVAGGSRDGDRGPAGAGAPEADGVPAAFKAVSVGRAYALRSAVRTARGAVAVRTAVVERFQARPRPPQPPPGGEPEVGVRSRTTPLGTSTARPALRVLDWGRDAAAAPEKEALQAATSAAQC